MQPLRQVALALVNKALGLVDQSETASVGTNVELQKLSDHQDKETTNAGLEINEFIHEEVASGCFIETSLFLATCVFAARPSAMERALPIDEFVPFDSSVEDTGDISNMTAEQYLSWVRFQANEMPDVFRAAVNSSLYVGRQTKYMPDIEHVAVCPEHLLPSTEWERDVISAFSDLRELLARLCLSESSRERKLAVPQLKDEQAWHKFCLGSECSQDEKFINMDVDEGAATNTLDIEQRKLELSRSLDINDVTDDDYNSAVLLSGEHYQTESHSDSDEEHTGHPGGSTHKAVGGSYAVWSGAEDCLPTTTLLLQFDQVMTQRILGYQVSWLQDRISISSARGQWLYGLLARLEKPLDRNVASLLRELYRRCSQLRASIDEKAETFEVQIASLNVLIAITGSYFGQGEEYSTLAVGYENDENDDGDGDGDRSDREDEDRNEDEDNDGDDYYFTGEVDGDVAPFSGGYRVGDDIWNDPTPMSTEEDSSRWKKKKSSGREEISDQSCTGSFLTKRCAENSAEDGEEVEEGEEVL